MRRPYCVDIFVNKKPVSLVMTILLLLLVLPGAMGQNWKYRRIEIVPALGSTFFFSDIGGYPPSNNLYGLRDLLSGESNIYFGAGVRYRFTKKINGRISFSRYTLKANDLNGYNPGRAFACTTTLFEPALLGEYYIFRNKSENAPKFHNTKKDRYRKIFRIFDVYVYSGIAAAVYTVEANDELASNLDISKGKTLVIPAGLGTMGVLSPALSLGVEMSMRYGFSDTLDGFTSDFSTSDDIYYSLGFTLTYKLWHVPVKHYKRSH